MVTEMQESFVARLGDDVREYCDEIAQDVLDQKT